MSLYEYKHPIINKELATGPDAASRKQFPTLEAWYDVVNDYEFQARCPIILKNSHRNKHFTFACHLKSCPFKVLLSYSGHNKDGPFAQHEGGAGSGADDDEDERVKRELGAGHPHAHAHGHGHAHSHSPSAGLKDEHDDVSAAIAAAVAAVTDGSNGANGNDNNDNNTNINGGSGGPGHGVSVGRGSAEDSISGPATGSGAGSDHNGSADDSLLDPDDPQQMSSVRGPFTVTKIDPYHNHPLESNLSLSKFVLTKVPRILQNDLKFDSILESLCNDEDNTVAKFRVSQYVEESGILDILKERYGLSDQDLDKKLLSHIARRITTYKARFVLKKKKNGTYGLSPSSMSAAAAAAAAINANGGNGAGAPGAGGIGHDNGGDLSGKKRGYGGSHHHNGVTGDASGDHDDELESRKRTRTNKISTAVKMGTRSSLVNDPALAQLDDVNDSEDNKPPEDLAEQLRLLSSHLKEVEQQQQQQQQQEQHHQNHQQHNHQGDHQLHQHQQRSHLHHSPDKDDIPDENIQPELRGQ